MSHPDEIHKKALHYHSIGSPGKFGIKPTKELITQSDLALAYTPGVAAPCREIHKNEDLVYEFTSKGNIVAVISNGTAVLGLGNIGPSASKPVMEGKVALFKRFADIDAIDIEVSTEDVDEFVNSIQYLGKSWGGVNLEDIKAPECFMIEDKLKKIMDIPVFHDDQHGTAIIVAAGMINAIELTQRRIEEVKIISNGAGAASIACIELLKEMGVRHENVILCDREGVIYKGRQKGMNPWKEKHAIETHCRTLDDAMTGADVFLGLSVKDALTSSMIANMASEPIIFAMANPDPETTPEKVRSVRQDAIIATGRSDYNNQINNVMGFPYIFRGALDVRAKSINSEMKIAAAKSLADLAKSAVPEEVYIAYPNRTMQYGKEYIIPVPFDPRLISTIPIAVAKAAIQSGVARKANIDFDEYKIELEKRLNPTAQHMDHVFAKISTQKQRIIFAEGETETAIKAAIQMHHKGYCKSVLVGRQDRIEPIVNNLGPGYSLDGMEIINAAITNKLQRYIDILYQKLCRNGYLKHTCSSMVKSDRNIFASLMLSNNDGDVMVTGINKSYYNNLGDISKVLSKTDNGIVFSYSIKITKEKNILIADSSIIEDPNASQLAQIALKTAKIVKSLGETPRIAFLSFGNFGDPYTKGTIKIKEAIQILDNLKVDFEYDGEMTADNALAKNVRDIYPFCRLSGPANILIMPDVASASIATNLLKSLSGGKFIGPIIAGFEKSVQLVSANASTNMVIKHAAFGAVEAINAKSS